MGLGRPQLESKRQSRGLLAWLMLVVVGHGPSIAGRGLGSWLDRQTVVRLKWADRPNAEDWGTRTDYLFACHLNYFLDRERLGKPKLAAEYWMLPERPYPEIEGIRQGSRDWLDYWATPSL